MGGNGNAYLDNTAGTEVTPAVNFRTDEDVDIETCTDAGGGYNIGYATSGEWLEYTVQVNNTATYDLDLRVACNETGRTVSISMDGVNVASNVAIPNTGGWQNWQTVTVKNIPITAGKKVMRLTIGNSDYVNLNYLAFKTMVITGSEESELSERPLYPNPFNNDGIHLNYTGEFSYYIADVTGRVLEEGKSKLPITVGKNLNQGLYFLTINQNNNSVSTKIIKQ